MFQKIPNYIKYIFTNVFVLFIFVVLFRFLFYFFFLDIDNSANSELKKAFFLGLRFDLKLAILTFFPLAILVLITNYRFFKRTVYKKISQPLSLIFLSNFNAFLLIRFWIL